MTYRKRKRSPAKDRKISDALDRLNGRQRMYVNGIAAGRTKKEAAIAAGYSASTANNAAAIIERAGVRKAFEELIQQAIPVEIIISRGMNRRRAALAAGYKELTANNARQVIEGHGLKRFSLMRQLCETIGTEKKGTFRHDD